jgi:hypothetical protein
VSADATLTCEVIGDHVAALMIAETNGIHQDNVAAAVRNRQGL